MEERGNEEYIKFHDCHQHDQSEQANAICWLGDVTTLFCRKITSHKTVEDYYRSSSSSQYLSNVGHATELGQLVTMLLFLYGCCHSPVDFRAHSRSLPLNPAHSRSLPLTPAHSHTCWCTNVYGRMKKPSLFLLNWNDLVLWSSVLYFR